MSYHGLAFSLWMLAYLDIFSHIACRCLFPCTVRSYFTGLFGLDCVAFEAITQVLCSPMRAGDTQRMVLCDLEMKEKGEVSFWEEIPVNGAQMSLEGRFI